MKPGTLGWGELTWSSAPRRVPCPVPTNAKRLTIRGHDFGHYPLKHRLDREAGVCKKNVAHRAHPGTRKGLSPPLPSIAG
jgi:hypothetical protein